MGNVPSGNLKEIYLKKMHTSDGSQGGKHQANVGLWYSRYAIKVNICFGLQLGWAFEPDFDVCSSFGGGGRGVDAFLCSVWR